MAEFLLEREGREKRPAAYLLGLAPHWLHSACVLRFFVPERVCLRFGFWHPGLVGFFLLQAQVSRKA
jgi:hypothetical protein